MKVVGEVVPVDVELALTPVVHQGTREGDTGLDGGPVEDFDKEFLVSHNSWFLLFSGTKIQEKNDISKYFCKKVQKNLIIPLE